MFQIDTEKHKVIIDPTKRHEFVMLFDVTNGNPNGDPDAENLPRIDPQTMTGLVTDVALKRKVRDYAAQILGKNIFIQSKKALNTLIEKAFKDVGVVPASITLTEQEQADEALVSYLTSLGESGFAYDCGQLTYNSADVTPSNIKKLLQTSLEEEGNEDISKDLSQKLADIAKRLADAAKDKKGIKPEDREKARKQMINDYYDIKMFGAVLSTGLNAGQVRGPVQLTFAKSIDPVLPIDPTITRQARTTEDRMKTGTTEMGRKPLIPYGLYRAHGFFNPFLAKHPDTKEVFVKEADLTALWEALSNLFEFDHSASRQEMAVQGLWVFTHDTEKGNAHAHKLFKLIEVLPVGDGKVVPRSFSDYESKVTTPDPGKLDSSGFSGVTLTRLV